MRGRKEAPRRCDYDGAKSQIRLHFGRCEAIVTQEYEKGALAAGLLTAISVGACMVIEAVL